MRTMTVQRRFQILQRADFTCAFCGSKPGNERLHVAHIWPHSRRGTEHENNLFAACDRCNAGTGTMVAIPRSMCTDERLEDGALVWKRWGPWVLSWDPECRISDRYEYGPLNIEFQPKEPRPNARIGYWFAIQRCREDWHRHLESKGWITIDDLCELGHALDFAKTLVGPKP